MSPTRPRRNRAIAFTVFTALVAIRPGPACLGDGGPFARFKLPEAWVAQFWDDPDTKALLKLTPQELADLVPVQAGFKFCRCPGCDTSEASDPLIWSALRPKTLTCRSCGQTFPNDKVPAKADNKVPEETIQVLPGLIHRYPYHAVAADAQHYPDERVYIQAKCDYERREALAKAALYAAVRHRDGPSAGKSDEFARFAALLILRFAQVYPAYATHFDQQGQPKYLQPADLAPPYRRQYRTGKWDWTASLDVPLNLVTAYALIGDDPAWAEAGKVLNDPNPRRTIEHGFFRASAEFVRRQPEEFDEMSLQAYRGLFAVARLLDDLNLLTEARTRLSQFSERGFYHDGYWREGNAPAHRRVVAQLDGWIERLASPSTPRPTPFPPTVPMLTLAREAGAAQRLGVKPAEIQQVGWPASGEVAAARRPGLLGGVGLARLSVGTDEDGLDIEVRGMGSVGSPHFQRQAIRVAVGGRAVLDDLDDLTPTLDGWDLASASHNTVIVDGLNQRETPMAAREVVDGGHFLYYAADKDFQVVALDDPLAYPLSTTRFRQIVVAASGLKARYGLSVFQVFGGLQHDQIFHGPAGRTGRWTASTPMGAGPESLLPANITYLPRAPAEDGRWFVQSYGDFRRVTKGKSVLPMIATLDAPAEPGVRLHVLGTMPLAVFSTLTPDPTRPDAAPLAAEAGDGRASLILRRSSEDGATLETTFVTVFDPVGAGPSLRRVGRVASSADTVVVYLDTVDGVEHVVINLKPGTTQAVRLADGRVATTDGLVLRAAGDDLQLAGGTTAHVGPADLKQSRLSGRVANVARGSKAGGRGWFEVEGEPGRFTDVEGRCLLIRHGDGSVHGWTIHAAEAGGEGLIRLHVREEPGFAIDPGTGEASYYQFPRATAPGPHSYSISRIARTSPQGR